MILNIDEPLAVAAASAIRAGDVASLRNLLEGNRDLAQARTLDARGCQRTLLHIATDWPGNFPNVAETIALLVDYGANVNAPVKGPHSETPLHWAASTDDVAALDALLDRGAAIEATGAVIAGGTPLADAVGFGQWKCARRLLERGAKANLWQSAAMGLMDRIELEFGERAPSLEEITGAFWCACHGGQRACAEFLLDRGADLNWVGWDNKTPLDAAKRSGESELAAWLESRQAASREPNR